MHNKTVRSGCGSQVHSKNFWLLLEFFHTVMEENGHVQGTIRLRSCALDITVQLRYEHWNINLLQSLNCAPQ